MPNAIRYLLAAVGLLIIAAAAVGAARLLGDSDDPPTTVYRVCDTIVRFRDGEKPEDLQVYGMALGGSTGDYRANMVMVIERGHGDGPEAMIDPRNGSIIRAPANTDAFGDVLKRVEVEPLNPADAPWPYTDRDKGEPATFDSLSYIPPARGAGLAMTLGHADGTPSGQDIRVTNCRSTMQVAFWHQPDGQVEKEVLADQVDPLDTAAFQRFADEIVLVAGP